jgi:hypothetical protein
MASTEADKEAEVLVGLAPPWRPSTVRADVEVARGSELLPPDAVDQIICVSNMRHAIARML